MGTQGQDFIPALDAKHDPECDWELEGVPENPSFWWKLVNLDPALVRGAVMSFGALAAAVGFMISDQKLGTFLGFLFSLMLIGQALWTKSAVIPKAKVVVYKPDPVNRPLELEPGPAVSTDIVQVANVAADTPERVRAIEQLPFPERIEG